MLPWQEEYLSNAREIVRLRDYGSSAASGMFSEARASADALLRRNNDLLNECFFPVLDNLHAAGPEDIAGLVAFGDALMDWKVNLDIGVYVTLHDALLRLYRTGRDRNGIIRELYRVGMGLYYQSRMLLGLENGRNDSVFFENELVFSEAASYFHYFAEIDDEETRGFIIRSLANIAICVRDPRRKIAASRRVLEVIRDPEIRALAPGLPWEQFLRGTHQQMSSNRVSLSRGDLNQDELSAVLDSCYEVFKPEESSSNPSPRWLWPYYEMEYNCGYVTLEITLQRLSRLIHQTQWNQYDVAGLYGNVQLPMIYAKLLRTHPELTEDPRQIAFLDEVCRRMERTLMTFPLDSFSDYFLYNLMLPFYNYVEIPGVPAYRDTVIRLMKRFFGDEYIAGRVRGDAMALCCDALLRLNGALFDDLPLDVTEPSARREALLTLARDAGLLLDLGRVTMNTIRRPRNLFDGEYRLTLLHPVIGRDALALRPSTRALADIAYGHHSWYNGAAPGYPQDYVRTESPYRQMTDVAAMVTFMMEQYQGDMQELLRQIYAEEGRRFSPLITPVLTDSALVSELEAILSGQTRDQYDQEILSELSRWEF